MPKSKSHVPKNNDCTLKVIFGTKRWVLSAKKVGLNCQKRSVRYQKGGDWVPKSNFGTNIDFNKVLLDFCFFFKRVFSLTAPLQVERGDLNFSYRIPRYIFHTFASQTYCAFP